MAELVEEIFVRFDIEINLYRLEKRLHTRSELSQVVILKTHPEVLQQRYQSYNLKRSARVAYPGESAEELKVRRQGYLDHETQRNELRSGRAAYPGESVEEQVTRRRDFQEAARIQNNISRGNAPRKGETPEEAKVRGEKFKEDQKVYNRNYNATVDKTEKLRKDRQYTGLLPYDGESEESRKSRHQKTLKTRREAEKMRLGGKAEKEAQKNKV